MIEYGLRLELFSGGVIVMEGTLVMPGLAVVVLEELEDIAA